MTDLDLEQLEAIIESTLQPIFSAFSKLLLALAREPRLSDETMAAADEIGKQVAALGGRDVGPPP